MDAAAPIVRRIGAYLGERFPLGPYAVLVALFFGSAVAFARGGGGGDGALAWLGAPVVLLAFFHLRVFDEHKDHAQDALAHPGRLLSRGVVDLPLLARLGAAAVLVELLLSALLTLASPDGPGPSPLLAWGMVFAFTVAMRLEFGLGAQLRPRIVLYAITHNPVVALLGLYAWACAGAAWDARFLWYLAAVSLGSLAFEIGRKLRLPDEEIAGVDSYSSALGRPRALLLLRGVTSLACASGLVGLRALGSTGLGFAAAAGLAGLGFAAILWATAGARPAKEVETGASLHLLLLMGGLWLGAALLPMGGTP